METSLLICQEYLATDKTKMSNTPWQWTNHAIDHTYKQILCNECCVYLQISRTIYMTLCQTLLFLYLKSWRHLLRHVGWKWQCWRWKGTDQAKGQDGWWCLTQKLHQTQLTLCKVYLVLQMISEGYLSSQDIMFIWHSSAIYFINCLLLPMGFAYIWKT